MTALADAALILWHALPLRVKLRFIYTVLVPMLAGSLVVLWLQS